MTNLFLFILVAFLGPVASESVCRSGWVNHKDKCYMFSRMAETWGVATSYCQAYHSKLAEPLTDDESTFLRTHAHSLRHSYWIGITDLISENEWVYSSNLQRIQSTDWAHHEPNGGNDQNCALLFYPQHSQWIDINCHASEYFICEMTVDESGPTILG
ncbi:C-type lectin domain family 3 member A-like [Crassostrea virginica]|uniref:Perlucin-like protein n=1 Tax=Crassostrea virginica TaxID=6565 RepID=A0A8B8C560_CRAVI|nr:perlucin-like protein [Crassostrea virginica]